MAKKYYWLKLMDDFFQQPKIKKLRRVAGGDTYTVIYLKMQLLSLKNEGKLYFEGTEDNFADEVALIIDEDVENVRFTIMYLLQQGLMDEVSEQEFALLETMKNIGSETDGAERVRRYREKKKMLQSNADSLPCNTDVTACNTEKRREEKEKIRKEIEIEEVSADTPALVSESPKKAKKPKESKHKYGEYQHVMLTDTEVKKLAAEYGEQLTDEAVVFLDEYIEMKGYKAKNHYLCIRKWVINAVNEQRAKQRNTYNDQSKAPTNKAAQELDDFYKMAAEWANEHNN